MTKTETEEMTHGVVETLVTGSLMLVMLAEEDPETVEKAAQGLEAAVNNAGTAVPMVPERVPEAEAYFRALIELLYALARIGFEGQESGGQFVQPKH